jgi:hypothetical protein
MLIESRLWLFVGCKIFFDLSSCRQTRLRQLFEVFLFGIEHDSRIGRLATTGGRRLKQETARGFGNGEMCEVYLLKVYLVLTGTSLQNHDKRASKDIAQ